MKVNEISPDFPFHASHEAVQSLPLTHRTSLPKLHLNPTNCYNNESPSMFRLDSMTQNKNGYNNPFLDEVIRVDRSEEFKKMHFNKEQINLIDKIKTRREYSQNPKILRYIRNEFDISMQNKRDRNAMERKNPKTIHKYTLTDSDANKNIKEKYNETISQLYHINPKLSYKTKRNLNLDNVSSISNGKMISSYDKENYRTLTCILDPKKSAYMKNVNDYHISEADMYDEKKAFHFDQKEKTSYNMIKDKIETIKPPVVRNHRWDSFHENFYMLMNAERGYRKKGGLFTEFANRNIGVIEINKRNDKEKKEYEKNNEFIQRIKSNTMLSRSNTKQ